MFSDAIGEKLADAARPAPAIAALQDQVSELFEESRTDVYRYLLTLGLTPPVAQEATQDVFLRYYVALRQGQKIESPRGWIFRVAHNLGLKIRSRENGQQAFDPQVEERLLDPQVTPEMTLLERERLLRFHRAVENLSEQQRRCLFLRLEGLRYPEIGSILGISASSVGEFIRRAIVRLRRLSHE